MSHHLTLWDFQALNILGREKMDGSEMCGLKLGGIPISLKTATLLFARIDILMGLVDG
jgi:hypothetical protein